MCSVQMDPFFFFFFFFMQWFSTVSLSPQHTHNYTMVISVHPLRLILLFSSHSFFLQYRLDALFIVVSIISCVCLCLVLTALLCSYWVTFLFPVLDCELLKSRVNVKTNFLAEISAHYLAQDFSINVYEINEQNYVKL